MKRSPSPFKLHHYAPDGLDETYVKVGTEWKYLYRANVIEQDHRAVGRRRRAIHVFRSMAGRASTRTPSTSSAMMRNESDNYERQRA
jgi:transposase-like protein